MEFYLVFLKFWQNFIKKKLFFTNRSASFARRFSYIVPTVKCFWFFLFIPFQVVGNVDLFPSTYSARIFLQQREVTTGDGKPRPQEWISNMKDAVKMIIEHFVERNRIMPLRIIMFRDGVGETMFLQVKYNKIFFSLKKLPTEIFTRLRFWLKNWLLLEKLALIWVLDFPNTSERLVSKEEFMNHL